MRKVSRPKKLQISVILFIRCPVLHYCEAVKNSFQNVDG